MTTETLEIRQLAHQFAESELRPHIEKWDRDGALDESVIAKLTELGFFDLAEFDAPTQIAVLEELAWGEPGVALLVAFNTKPSARLGLILDERGMYIVPDEANLGERINTTGFRTVQLLNAGQTPDARRQTPDALLQIAAISLGIAQAALDHTLSYADIREQFKTKLREFEATQFKLAEMATRIHATRALLQHAAANPSDSHAAMSKLFASETAMWVSNQAVQIFGGYGYMRDYPVEKLMREAKAVEMLEVPNEILRTQIAQALYDQEG
ncbi:MAG TPA: acyl-CoA dehydrogenase family protein [Longimicrobiales bacterium]|nr:acyl-CoA dehydrogenase family protein [Longimicrobiales bacterium]